MEAVLTNTVNGYQPLYAFPNGDLLVSKKFSIFLKRRKEFTHVAAYRPGVKAVLKSISRPIRRLFRTGFHYALPTKEKALILVVGGAILRFDPDSRKLQTVFKVTSGSRPLNLCCLPDGTLYFGEYFNRPRPEPVKIYGSDDDGRSWRPVYAFDRNPVRHVHGIYFDQYRNGCWVLTGDSGPECRISFTDNHFKTLPAVCSGDQRARALSIIPLKDRLIVPMDSPLEKNYIQTLSPETGRLRKTFPLQGSAFYAGTVGRNLLVATCVEPSKVNTSPYAALYLGSADGMQWKEIFRGRKDRWPARYFQYGVFALPAGQNRTDTFAVYARSLRGMDDVMLEFKLLNHDQSDGNKK